jgi:hypothetical protein
MNANQCGTIVADYAESNETPLAEISVRGAGENLFVHMGCEGRYQRKAATVFLGWVMRRVLKSTSRQTRRASAYIQPEEPFSPHR